MSVVRRRRRNTAIPPVLLAEVLRLSVRDAVVRYAWELGRIGLRCDEQPIAAIYAIVDLIWRDVYFGETSNVYRRQRSHNAQLRAQTHHNLLLRNGCRGIDNRRWHFVVLEESHLGKRHRLERQAWWIAHVPTCLNALNDQLSREFRALYGL